MHMHIAVVKNTAENFDRHVRDIATVKIIFVKNSQHSLKLAVSALTSVRAGCVKLIAGQFQSQGQKSVILASDSSSESPRPPWWFLVAGKDSS